MNLHDDLNDLVGRLLDERTQHQHRCNALAAFIIDVERFASALTHQAELAKTTLTGLTPTGRDAGGGSRLAS
jgi:hypothetical protein